MYLTVTEIAARLAVSRKVVRRWIADGRLPAVYLPNDSRKHARVAVNDFEQFLRNLRENSDCKGSSD